MSEPKKVKVLELSDRYLVVDAETGDNVDIDDIGFSYEDSAKRWAEREGYEVISE